jgi:hypothetical protein
MKDTNKNSVALNPIIDRTISRIEMHEHNVDLCMDILEWNEAIKARVKFSEDESEINQNFIGLREVEEDDGYEDYIHQELHDHKQELANQKILLRIYMEAFHDGGWQF